MLTPAGLKDALKNSVSGMTNYSEARQAFWSALQDYFKDNAEVTYSWAGASPDGPDPIVVINATLDTSPGQLSGAVWDEDALKALSDSLNTEIAKWKVSWPTGWSLSPALVIPNISLSFSNLTDQDSAFLHICSEIIAGVTQATPEASGSHGGYAGGATFTSIK